jgi:hypothetical protein
MMMVKWFHSLNYQLMLKINLHSPMYSKELYTHSDLDLVISILIPSSDSQLVLGYGLSS